jgi:putative endonuclease
MGPRNKCGDDSLGNMGSDSPRWICNNFSMHYISHFEEKIYCVYIMANKKNGTLYIGVSGDLPSRVTQHKEGLIKGFTQKYYVKTLVWFETFGDIHLGIQREKTMKKWPRQWKINVIAKENPVWNDLYETIL